MQKDSKKRLSLRLSYDLGPNPTQKQIEKVLKASIALLEQAKNLGQINIV